MPKQIYKEWTKQKEWEGNPALGYESWTKHFKNPHNGRLTPVQVFGRSDSKELSFCVSAGASSDFSFSGCFYPEKHDFAATMTRVDLHYKQGKLFK